LRCGGPAWFGGTVFCGVVAMVWVARLGGSGPAWRIGDCVWGGPARLGGAVAFLCAQNITYAQVYGAHYKGASG